MKQHAFCFRFEITKEHSNQNKKNQLKQIQNQNFKFDFEIHSKLYLELFDFALYPRRKISYIWGLLDCALYPAHERLFVFAKERSFLSRTKV